MRLRPLVIVMALQVPLLIVNALTPFTLLTFSLLSSGLFLESQRDFESMAKRLTDGGIKASAPASIVGKSGVKHEFALAILSDSSVPRVVVDTELSIKEVDEMKVLSFYVKVFDVSPEHAVLCVSPRLSEGARKLAGEYKLIVIENESPRKLVPATAETVERLIRRK
jgi:hypothetical protein